MEASQALLPALALLVASLTIIVARRISFWKAEGIRNLTPGHIPPVPGFLARSVRSIVLTVMRRFAIGPVRVLGAVHLNSKRRLVQFGTHQTERDAVLVPYVTRRRRSRFFIAKTQAVGWWRAPLVAYGGGIVVEHDSKRGPVMALTTAIKALVAEPRSDFLIFPQGKLVPDNVLKREDFYAGAAVMGLKVAKSGDQDLAFLPFAVYYDRNPAHATLFHKFVMMLGFKNFRRFFGEVIYGAVVAFGEPIPVASLPKDADAITDILFAEVVKLSAQAAAEGER